MAKAERNQARGDTPLAASHSFAGKKKKIYFSLFNKGGGGRIYGTSVLRSREFYNNKALPRVNSLTKFELRQTKRYYSTGRNPGVDSSSASKILTDFLKENNLKPVYCYEDLHLESTKEKYEERLKILAVFI